MTIKYEEGKTLTDLVEEDESELKPLQTEDAVDDETEKIRAEIKKRTQRFKSLQEEFNGHKTNEHIHSIFQSLKKKPPKEYDNEDDIARGLLADLKDMIKKELDSKQKSRTRLTYWLMIAFSLIGLSVIGLTFFSMYYDTKIVLAMISGFFVNTIGLVLILLKYMFSPSKELYDYTLGIFKRKNGD